jgi:uncharacterized protein (TIRG00374 family)
MTRDKVARQKKIKAIITIVTLVVLALVTYGIRDQIGETIENLRTANPWPILLIVPLAFANHYGLGKLYQGVFRILGDRFRTRSMVRLSFEINFVNNVFPSAGVSGFSYISLRMRGEHVAAGKSALVQVMRFALVFISFQLLLGLGLLFLSLTGDVNNFVIMVTASLVTLLFVGTALALFIISSKARINGFFTGLTRIANRLIQVLRPKNPETINISRVEKLFTELHNNYQLVRHNLTNLKKPLLFAFLANLTEVLSIFVVFWAFGEPVNIGAVVIAYAVANFAGIMSILPGGVGVYEGLMTAVLVATGVPVAISLPAIVTFRIISMATQIPIGYYYYQRNLSEQTHI